MTSYGGMCGAGISKNSLTCFNFEFSALEFIGTVMRGTGMEN